MSVPDQAFPPLTLSGARYSVRDKFRESPVTRASLLKRKDKADDEASSLPTLE